MKTMTNKYYLLLFIFYIFCVFTLSAQELPHGFVPVSTSRVYVEGGGRGPALIFVHAGFQDHQMWEPQVNEFIKDNKIILIDMPGHGKND